MHPWTNQNQLLPFQQQPDKKHGIENTIRDIIEDKYNQANKPHKKITSIAEIILQPHESIVSFHSGKPSGITGSELSSYQNGIEVSKQ
jgi:hypothetical protein